MNLRVRILLSYGYLFALLLVSATGAALGFQKLGQAIGQVLAENFSSVQAAKTMLESLERQESALRSLWSGEEAARDGLAAAQKQFTAGLEQAKESVRLEAEKGIVATIEASYAEIAIDPAQPAPVLPGPLLLSYERKTFPDFNKVRQQIFELIEINHGEMVKADDYAQRSALRNAIIHALLVTVALFSLGFLTREMQRLVLDRIDELKAVAQGIAAGQRRRRASVVRQDELGLVAQQLNAALDNQEEVEAEMQGRLAQQRQLLLALLAARGRPSALFSFSGELIASTLEPAETVDVGRALVAARERGELETPRGGAKVRRRRFKLTAGEHVLGVRLLEAPEGRLVGWLASFEPREDAPEDDGSGENHRTTENHRERK